MISRSYAEKKLQPSAEAEMDVLPLENIILQLLVGLQDERSQKILLGRAGGGADVVGDEVAGAPAATSEALAGASGEDYRDTGGTSRGTKVEAQRDIIQLFRDCLKYAPSPPVDDAITIGLTELEMLGAVEYVSASGRKVVLDEIEKKKKTLRVTPLGHLLVKLPCDARLGKLLIFSAILGCGMEGASLCAMLSVKSPLMRVYNKGDIQARTEFRRKHLKPGGTKSDHCFLASLLLLSEAGLIDCERLKISETSIKDARKVRQQYLQSLSQLGFYHHCGEDHTDKAKPPSWHLLRAAVVATFFLVKTIKPSPVFRRLANGSSVMDTPDPLQTKYFQLERDPFAYKLNKLTSSATTGSSSKYQQQTNPIRYFPNANSLFEHEGPNMYTTYMVHTNIFCNSQNLSLQKTQG
eukprot:g13537.t1